MNPSTPPKGSLEDLFRHHLLESEAAAVPPRPHVWEQLDNSLLLAQNEQYRRRLRVHRWAIAASLLLAMLSGGGWWHSQQATPDLAQATPTGAAGIGAAGRQGARLTNLGLQSAATSQSATGGTSAASAAAKATYPISSSSTQVAFDQTSTSSSQKATTAAATAHQPVAVAAAPDGAGTQSASRTYGSPQVYHAVVAGRTASRVSHLAKAGRTATWAASYATSTTKPHGAQALLRVPAAQASATAAIPAEALATDQLATASSRYSTLLANAADDQQAAATEALALRLAQLRLADSQALPTALAARPMPEEPAPTVTRRWQFGLDYAVTAFRPNIDFAKDASAYNPALGSSSPRLTQQAAAEYRSNLHTGLGQRIGGWAARRLGNGRFNLRMGLELAQNSATSATSMAFVGEQVPDLLYTMPAQPHATSYRYRSASVPVELRYSSNPLKSGFSFYSRLGGLLTALLNVRSEVDGNPEATRTYTPLSGSSPYRHVSGSVRGAAGFQYRPTGHQWAFSLGPVAEVGILSMNADPTQDFWSQKRPYSFGLEAGVELGRSPRLLLK